MLTLQNGAQPYSLPTAAPVLPEPESASKAAKKLLMASKLAAKASSAPAPEPFDMFSAAQPHEVPAAAAGANGQLPLPAAAAETASSPEGPLIVQAGPAEAATRGAAHGAQGPRQPYQLKRSRHGGEVTWTQRQLDLHTKDTW